MITIYNVGAVNVKTHGVAYTSFVLSIYHVLWHFLYVIVL